MASPRAKRIGLAIGLFFAVVLVAALVGAYMLSRDISFGEATNVLEANNFRTKLKRYNTAVTNGNQGFVRFSQLEINSYISRTLTNVTDANPKMHLRRVAVGLTDTNLMLYSWGEYHFLGALPLKFVVQRGFQIKQEGTNQWEMPLASLKIGEVEVPPKYWDRVTPMLESLDQPVKEKYAWATNVPALLITKNEVSQKPELRFYTYKPIPDEDRRLH